MEPHNQIQLCWVACLQDSVAEAIKSVRSITKSTESPLELTLAAAWLDTTQELGDNPPVVPYIIHDAPATKRKIDTFLVTGNRAELSFRHPYSILNAVQELLIEDFENRSRIDYCVVWIKFLRQTLGLYSRLTVAYDHRALKPFFAEMRERLIVDPSCPTREDIVLAGEVGRAVFAHYSLSRFVDWDPEVPPHYADGPGVVAEHDPDKLVKFVHAQSKPLGYAGLHVWPDWITRSTLLGTEYSELGAEKAGRYLNIPEADCSEVKAVPKDYRGPRGIAEEPCWSQYIQQGIRADLYEFFPRSPLKDVIHITDQTFNQEAARQGSYWMDVATIDLKDASDTVRVSTVSAVLRRRPDLLSVLLTARTGIALFPDGSKAEISSFATMGSAICFPMESIMYSVISLAACWREAEAALSPRYGLPITPRNVVRVARYLRLLVYGDDIIIRQDCAENLICALRRWGFIPSDLKCCIHTHFRESCGADAYYGKDVTVLRPRHLPGSSERSLAGDIENARDAANRGMWHLVQVLTDLAACRWHAHIPIVTGWDHPSVVTCPHDARVITDRPAELRRAPGGIQEGQLHVKVQCFDSIQPPSVVQAYRASLNKDSARLTPWQHWDHQQRIGHAWAMVSLLSRYASLAQSELGLPAVRQASEPVDPQRPKIKLRWVLCPQRLYALGTVTPAGAAARLGIAWTRRDRRGRSGGSARVRRDG